MTTLANKREGHNKAADGAPPAEGKAPYDGDAAKALAMAEDLNIPREVLADALGVLLRVHARRLLRDARAMLGAAALLREPEVAYSLADFFDQEIADHPTAIAPIVHAAVGFGMGGRLEGALDALREAATLTRTAPDEDLREVLAALAKHDAVVAQRVALALSLGDGERPGEAVAACGGAR
ncbi:MAG: hypothetical protein ACODAG_11790 [Myxococcota bacterium]